jgi:hypothetical protein
MWVRNQIVKMGYLNLCASTISKLKSIKSNKIAAIDGHSFVDGSRQRGITL